MAIHYAVTSAGLSVNGGNPSGPGKAAIFEKGTVSELHATPQRADPIAAPAVDTPQVDIPTI